MPCVRDYARYACAVLLLIAFKTSISPAQELPRSSFSFRPAKLTYRIEWRLVTAGTADLQFTRAGGNALQVELKLESAGLVSRLYRVLDTYRVFMDDRYCVSSAHLNAQEGKRHNVTELNVDASRKKSVYDEHDLVKNTAKHAELDVPACTHEITGALAALRQMDLLPGKSVTLPVTDGKKLANVRIEMKSKETISVGDQKYQAIRYEAFVFDNVLYKRKGTLQVWLTDDAERTPVQFRLQLGFPVGTVSLEMVKKQDL